MEEGKNQFSTGAMFADQACSGRVLIVDDEPDVRKVVKMTLEKAGYAVLEAENGAKAARELKTGDNPLLLDVIITDIRMPNMNGLEAIKFFQQEFPLVSVIVLTGFPDVNMATSLMQQGVIDYLIKPVDKEQLLAAVSKAMSQREISRL